MSRPQWATSEGLSTISKPIIILHHDPCRHRSLVAGPAWRWLRVYFVVRDKLFDARNHVLRWTIDRKWLKPDYTEQVTFKTLWKWWRNRKKQTSEDWNIDRSFHSWWNNGAASNDKPPSAEAILERIEKLISEEKPDSMVTAGYIHTWWGKPEEKEQKS